MKLNRKWLLAIALVLSLTMAISSTLAYLTSEDTDVNVMTLGKVEIEQHEYQRVVENGSYKTDTIDNQNSYVLEAFEQAKPLLPIVGDPSLPGNNAGYAGWDDTTVRMSQVGSYGGMQVFAGKNAQDKFVTVENTGRSAAYVRTIIAFESGSVTVENFDNVISSSVRATSNLDEIGTNVPWSSNFIGSVNIDGNNYMVWEYVYAGAQLSDGSYRHAGGVLPAGDTTYPNLSQVYMKSAATNEDVEAIDGNGNGTYDIMVLSQAVQADGFDNATTALNAGFGEVNAANVQSWFGGLSATGGENSDATKVNNLEELKANLNGGVLKTPVSDDEFVLTSDEAIVFDGNNSTIVMDADVSTEEKNYGYLGFVPTAGEDVTVSNLKVTGKGFVELGHYGQGGGDYVATNLVIKDLAASLKSVDGSNAVGIAFCHYGNATLNNCTMTGATAMQEGTTPYDAGFVHDTTTVINGGTYGKIYMWNRSTVTINNASVDQVDASQFVRTSGQKLTIGSGTHIGTLNLICDAEKRQPAVTIEAGATVDKIVFGGTEYTQQEWSDYVQTKWSTT